MCKYCDYESNENEIFVDPLDGEYYLDVQTNEWDSYDDGFVHQKIYISYCPYCGRKLKEEDKKMDYQEALEHISRNLLDPFSKPIAINALEKQIPKKPNTKFEKRINGRREWFCICGSKLYEVDYAPLPSAGIEYGHKACYCKDCGQAIDWSE